jgi:hypothetical protein
MTGPIVYVPIRLAPEIADPPLPLTLFPGVTLERLAPEDIASKRFGTVPALPFRANTLLRIDGDAYETAARARLEPRSVYQPAPSSIDGTPVVLSTSVTRWILTATLLITPFEFEFGPHYRTQRVSDAAREATISAAPGEHHAARFIGAQATPGKLFPDAVISTAQTIEEYFRLAPFRMDRIAVALGSIWTAACSQYPEQSFLGLFTVLESLFATNDYEVTHQLAERAAFVSVAIGRSGPSVYRALKQLYGLRSSIIHGRGATKDDLRRIRKRQQTTDPPTTHDIELLLHPMRRILPQTKIVGLWGVVTMLFRAALATPPLYDALRSGDDQQVDRFFINNLLRPLEKKP